MHGIIQSVFPECGFGFIRADSGIKYYFRSRSLKNSSIEQLVLEQEVTFEDSQEKGLETADDVFVIK